MGQDVRQVAGLTLKAMMERNFVNLTEESIEYFKENILRCYLDKNQTIRKTIANLINTFIRLGGMEIWPEILNFLLKNLESELGVGMSLETLNIIIEDSGSYLEDKFEKFLLQLIPKLANYLEKMGVVTNLDKTNQDLLVMVLSTVYVLLENCPNKMSDDLGILVKILFNLHSSQNLSTRYQLGKCWLAIVRMKKEILIESFENLFNFFLHNFTVEHYEMNFISAEFFMVIIEENEEELIKEEIVANVLQNNLKK